MREKECVCMGKKEREGERKRTRERDRKNTLVTMKICLSHICFMGHKLVNWKRKSVCVCGKERKKKSDKKEQEKKGEIK